VCAVPVSDFRCFNGSFAYRDRKLSVSLCVFVRRFQWQEFQSTREVTEPVLRSQVRAAFCAALRINSDLTRIRIAIRSNHAWILSATCGGRDRETPGRLAGWWSHHGHSSYPGQSR
jgi:hypothetical protein